MFWYILFTIVGVIAMFYLFPLARVQGESMKPTLQHGQTLICTRLFCKNHQVGKIFVVKHPKQPGKLIIKRLDHIVQEGECRRLYFVGDNHEASSDSREYGYVCHKNVVARALVVLRENAESGVPWQSL